VIDSSKIEEVGGKARYIFRVSYRYCWRGRDYTSSAVREEYDGSWDIAESDRLLRDYPAGTRRVCFVNPRGPNQAILEHSSLIAPIALATFMLVDSCFLLLVFLDRRDYLENLTGPLLAAFGTLGYAVFFGMPLLTGIASWGWTETRCAVVSSEVRPRGKLRLSPIAYWPDVVFCYELDGVTYRANTHNASFVGSPWYYGPRGIARRFPAGLTTTCFVNPANPGEAVLERTPSGTQWFGLYPLSLSLLGVYAAWVRLTGRGIRIGSPRIWGCLMLWAATTLSLTTFSVTLLDFLRDRREGIAERPEYGIVMILGFLSAVFLLMWIGLALGHSEPRSHRALTVKSARSKVSDREIDG
jgi:hypothetical protein